MDVLNLSLFFKMDKRNRLNFRRNTIQQQTRDDFLNPTIDPPLPILNFPAVNFCPLPPPPFYNYLRFIVLVPPTDYLKFKLIRKK